MSRVFCARLPLAVLAILIIGAASAAEYRINDLKIERPWTRATPRGAQVGVGYLRITNAGTAPDRLVGGSFESAKRVDLHATTIEQGVARMRPLTSGLEIKPGETVELKPGGFHLMFSELRQPIAEGDIINGTLVFEKAGRVEIQFQAEGFGRGEERPAHGPGGH